VITGGDLLLLQAEGLWGNAWSGGGELLVVEADESDGSLVRYQPSVSVILNLERDHREMSEVGEMFAVLGRQMREARIVGEGGHVASLAEGATVFGSGPAAEVRATQVMLGPGSSEFEVNGVRFRLPVPGRYNVENAVAAIAACRALSGELQSMLRPLAEFRGVARRFQCLGAVRGIEVIDDFAHNPAKLKASIETAHHRLDVTAERDGRDSPGRLLAVYQPHGYGPTRFLRPEFVNTFADLLRPRDRLWLLEIYYAGGTAVRDFSASDIVAEIAARGALAEFAPTRDWLIERLATEAREGDLILIMGARDATLTDLGVAVLAAIESRAPRLSGAPSGPSR